MAKCKQQEDIVKQHAKLNEAQSHMDVKCSNLEKELNDKMSIIEKMDETIQDLTSQSKNSKAKEDELKIIIEKLQTDLNETLQKNQSSLEKSREEYENTVKRLEKEHCEQIQENDALISDYNAKQQELNDSIKKLQNELDESQHAKKDFIDEEIETLKSQLQVCILLNYLTYLM